MTKRRLTNLELQAWRRITRSVRPLTPEKMADQNLEADIPEQAPHKQEPKAYTPNFRAIVAAQTPTQKPRRQTVVNRKPEKRVRRGKLEIDATIDLHGLTVLQAIGRLQQFLNFQTNTQAHCILVITGKGHPTEGKIRREFRLWLEHPDTAKIVSGYSEAHARHGGSGAFYVFLRKAKPN